MANEDCCLDKALDWMNGAIYPQRVEVSTTELMESPQPEGQDRGAPGTLQVVVHADNVTKAFNTKEHLQRLIDSFSQSCK